MTPPTLVADLKNTYDFPESSNPLSKWLTLILKLLFLKSVEVAPVFASALVSIGSTSSFSYPSSSFESSNDAVLEISNLARWILNLRSSNKSSVQSLVFWDL